MKHSNRLIHELSPYLLQHAHNPVDWYPWGEEALNRARKEDKPILISIGYSACHWCHVMERESFEDEAIASFMNEHFVNIKVDREERPDLDNIYMDALQTMTGGGGWPLNVFLTPNLQPFFGGTYFPPKSTRGMASWMEVLKNIWNAYTSQRDKIEEQAHKLTEHLKQANTLLVKHNTDETNWLSTFWLQEIENNLEASIDKEWGGMGHAPKFPQTGSLHFLLARQYQSFLEKIDVSQPITTALLSMPAQGSVFLTIDKILQGGIYDQVGGGIARYATDRRWLVPHFEKMLYDNALFITLLCDAYKTTKEWRYANAIHECIAFIERDMLQAEGAFFSALDADSDGKEGVYYTWQKTEIENLICEDADLFCDLFNVTAHGNWEETNILYRFADYETFAQKNNIQLPQLQVLIKKWKERLLNARYERTPPFRDEKIILSWNALMNTACSQAYAATGHEKYKELAVRNMAFLLTFLQGEGHFFHSWNKGQTSQHAFLDDYAALAIALVHLYEITGSESYVYKAGEIMDYVLDQFCEQGNVLCTYTPLSQKDVILKKLDMIDGATHSGNALVVKALKKLAAHLGRSEWELRAIDMVQALGRLITKYPTSFGLWANNLLHLVQEDIEVVTVGTNEVFHKEMLKNYMTGAIYAWNKEGNSSLPLLKNRGIAEKTLVYVCKNKTCRHPVNDLSDAIKELLT